MTNWKKEICATKPLIFTQVSDKTYIQRRNIIEITHEATEERPSYKDYECESRFLNLYEAMGQMGEISDSINATEMKNSANIDYISMMTGTDIPTAEAAK